MWYSGLRPASRIVLVDRDGTLNRRNPDGYVFSSDDLELLPDTLDLLRLANCQGVPVIVVTNQGGIARGIYSWPEVLSLHQHMTQLLSEQGVILSGIICCPHHPSISSCACRKPSPVMLRRVLEDFGADPGLSLFIGDSESDRAAAHQAGVTYVDLSDHAALATWK